MIVLDSAEKPNHGVCLMVGNYDGIHRGHQRIIDLVRMTAMNRGLKTAVLSFEPHPLKVLGHRRAPELIHSPLLKQAWLDYFGIDYYLVEQFTPDFARLEPSEFVLRLKQWVDFKVLLVGSEFRFGAERRGDTCLLRNLGLELGFELIEVDEVGDAQGSISSTRIRQLIADGRIEEAESLLGHPYFLEGHVGRGRRVGRKLGTPTANLVVANELIPKHGVYASWSWVGDAWLRSVTNIGTRPTFGPGAVCVETHVLGFSEQIYRRHLVVCLKRYLRGEHRFDGPQGLRLQIQKDIEQRRALNDTEPPALRFLLHKGESMAGEHQR